MQHSDLDMELQEKANASVPETLTFSPVKISQLFSNYSSVPFLDEH